MLATYASLEAQAAAIADDIAYNAHDIDDALRAGLLSMADLVDVPLVGPIVREVLGRWPDIEGSRQAHEVQRRLITRMIEDVIATATGEIAELAPSSSDDVRNCGRALIHFSPEVAQAEAGLKSFMFERVYRSEAVMEPVRRSEAIVADLFDRYLANSASMPTRWARVAAGTATDAERARVVADFIAGMTDPYAEAEHARLFDGKPAVE
jgi:dGTPase